MHLWSAFDLSPPTLAAPQLVPTDLHQAVHHTGGAVIVETTPSCRSILPSSARSILGITSEGEEPREDNLFHVADSLDEFCDRMEPIDRDAYLAEQEAKQPPSEPPQTNGPSA